MKVDLNSPLIKDLPTGGSIITPKSGRALYVRTWEPTVPAIAVLLFFHGLGEHCDRYDHSFTKFADNGIRVKSFDHRGHGRTAFVDARGSKGHLTLSEDYEDAHTVLQLDGEKDAGLPLFVFGHSMGGLLAILFVQDHPELKVAGLLASAPAIRPGIPPPGVVLLVGRLIGKLAPSMTITNGLDLNNLSRDTAVMEDYVKDPLNHGKISVSLGGLLLDKGEFMLTQDFSSMQNLPIYIAHGQEDRLTCPRSSLQFFEQLKVSDKTYRKIDGAYHELHNETEPTRTEVIDGYINWIKEKAQVKASL